MANDGREDAGGGQKTVFDIFEKFLMFWMVQDAPVLCFIDFPFELAETADTKCVQHTKIILLTI